MARFRVPEYWIIDPRSRMIEMSRLSEAGHGASLVVSDGRCASSVVPGFEVDLADLFADGLAI